MNRNVASNLRENRIWYGAGALVIVLTIVLGYIALTIEPVDRDLKVDEVFFKSVEYGEDETDLNIIVFLTNDGDSEISEVRVRAFAIEIDSNLARSEDTVVIGKIDGQTTEEGELSISVPNRDSYRIELLVFEDSKMTIKGSGTINLKQVGVDINQSHGDGGASAADFDIDNDDGGSLLESEGNAAFIGTALCMVLIPAAIIVVIIIAVVASSRKNKDRRPVRLDDERSDPGRQRAQPIKGLTKIEDFQEEKEEEYD